MSTPEPTPPKSPALLEKRQKTIKEVMTFAIFADPLDKANENYKTFGQRQADIASYRRRSEDLAKANAETHNKKVEEQLKQTAQFNAQVQEFKARIEKAIPPISEQTILDYYAWKTKEEEALRLLPEELKQSEEGKIKVEEFNTRVQAFQKVIEQATPPISEQTILDYYAWKTKEEEALRLLPEEIKRSDEEGRSAETKLKNETNIYKTILAQEANRCKIKANEKRKRIKVLKRKKNKTPEEIRELGRLERLKEPYEEYKLYNRALKIKKLSEKPSPTLQEKLTLIKLRKLNGDYELGAMATVNPAILPADSRLTQLIAKNELHESVQLSVISEIQPKILQPGDKSALEHAVEYSIGQLEGVGDVLLSELKKKCIESGWIEEPPGNFVYKKPPDLPNLEMSIILTSTYNAYVTTGVNSYIKAMPSTITKAKFLEDANITTTLEPVQSKEPVKPEVVVHLPILTEPELTDPTKKPPAVLNPQVMLTEFIDSKRRNSVTLTPVDTPAATVVGTPVTPTVIPTVAPTDPPTSTPSAKLDPEFKHFCDAVVTNYSKHIEKKVDVEEAANKMKITTPPPWEIRKITPGKSEITIPHDDSAALHIILSAIKAAADAYPRRPVHINLQDPKQIEFAIAETNKVGIKHIITPDSQKILDESRAEASAKDTEPPIKKGAHL